MNDNMLLGLLVLIGSIFYTGSSFFIPEPRLDNYISPQLFPLVVGSLLIFISVILITKGILEQRQKRGENEESEDKKEKSYEQKERIKKIIILFLILIAYIILFFPLGYILSTTLFILSLTMFLERKRWIRNIAYSLIFPVIIYLFFNQLLSVYLPPGPLI